jgi:hypothetical protein
MTSKQELIQFVDSFPGADAKLLSETIASYVTGDNIQYKKIIVPSSIDVDDDDDIDAKKEQRDIEITNTNNTLNVKGSLEVKKDIKCVNITPLTIIMGTGVDLNEQTTISNSIMNAANINIYNSLTTPSIKLSNLFFTAKEYNIGLDLNIDYTKTVIISHGKLNFSSKLTYGDKIYFSGSASISVLDAGDDVIAACAACEASGGTDAAACNACAVGTAACAACEASNGTDAAACDACYGAITGNSVDGRARSSDHARSSGRGCVSGRAHSHARGDARAHSHTRGGAHVHARGHSHSRGGAHAHASAHARGGAHASARTRAHARGGARTRARARAGTGCDCPCACSNPRFFFKGIWELTEIIDDGVESTGFEEFVNDAGYRGSLSMSIFDNDDSSCSKGLATIITHGEALIIPTISNSFISKNRKISNMIIEAENVITGGTGIYEGLNGVMSINTGVIVTNETGRSLRNKRVQSNEKLIGSTADYVDGGPAFQFTIKMTIAGIAINGQQIPDIPIYDPDDHEVDGGPVDEGPVDEGPVDGGPVDEGPVDEGDTYGHLAPTYITNIYCDHT